MNAVLVCLALVALTLGSTVAQKCVQGENCHLPDCSCPTFTHPNFTNVKDIPQMVYFGFDDAVTVEVEKYYSQLFTEARRNPNGCPITMSLYVQDTWTDYSLVKANFERGMDIGSHSVNHTNVDTRAKLLYQAGQQKENLIKKGGVARNQVVGWRSPNLVPAGDAQPEVLKELKYTYDITLTYTRASPDDEVPWPYTLDFGDPYNCGVPPCPGRHKKHPGFWEIPVNSLYNWEAGFFCTYVDSCRPSSEKAAVDYLWRNFEKVYKSNRAPFGLNMHAAWFFVPDYLKATHTFIERLLTLDDVYIISANQVLAWMRKPVKVSEAVDIPEWGCKNPGPTRGPTTTHHTVPTSAAKTTTRTTPPTTTTTTTTTKTTPTTTTTTPSTTRVRSTTTTATTTTATIPTTTTTTTSTRIPARTRPAIRGGSSPLILDRCANDTCSLPHCQCRSLLPPAGLSPLNTPQIVYLAIEGGVDRSVYQRVIDLLNPAVRHNPNGCPVSATFFVPQFGNYLPFLQLLRNSGNEIAMSGSQRFEFNQRAPLEQQVAVEVTKFRSLNDTGVLSPWAGARGLGYRSPDAFSLEDKLLAGLSGSDVLYDSSLVLPRRASLNDVIPWPYTLDYGWRECEGRGPSASECPSGHYSGLWEVPIVPLVDYKKQFICLYADSCYHRPPTAHSTFQFFMQNLEQTMKGNRAPMGIQLRREWFSHPVYNPNLEGLQLFLDAILKSRDDVYVVSVEKMLDWMRYPTSLADLASFQPWQC